jgi:osmotically-inducible protein OsmY
MAGREREYGGYPKQSAAEYWAPNFGWMRPGPARTFHRGPKGYRRSDQRLLEDICETIASAGHIDASDVTVDVQDGRVSLEGTVPARYMKHAIEDLADTCPGVQDIGNRVRVRA